MFYDKPRNISIPDYINNYSYSINEMMAARPLPGLVPINPFPDPYKKVLPFEQTGEKLARWPCTMSKPETRLYKPRTLAFYPRPRDWMHDWSEDMYRLGVFGAKQKKK